MLGRTPIGVKSASKKLTARLRNKPLTAADILGSVIKRPKNKSFFRSISDSIELRFEILRRWPGTLTEHSPLLHTPPGSSSTSTSGTPTRPKPSNFDYPNTVPVIFRDADPKFNSVKQIMSELSQYHPELSVSRVKDIPNKGFLIIGNTPRDILTLQSENKMKACLSKNLKISLPKAYQIKE